MKSEYFSSQPSQIRGTREKEIEETINWDRIVYLTMLGIAGILLAYFLFDYYMIVEGQGRVIANRYEVRFPVDVRVTDLYVEEGDSVQSNDRLFSFAIVHQAQSPEQTRDEKRRLQEQILNVEGDIQQRQAQLSNSRDRLKYYRQQKELVQKEIRLGVSNIRDLRAIERDIMSEKQDSALAASRLQVLRQEKSTLQEWMNAPQMFNLFAEIGMEGQMSGEQAGEQGNESIEFTSPSQGVVERVSKNASELAMRSESIVTIKKKTKEIFIRAIFERDGLEYISEGDTLNVDFDNGSESGGVVIGFDTPQISNWDVVGIGEYGNINKYAVVRLKPVDEKAFDTWQKNSNVGLTIRKVIL